MATANSDLEGNDRRSARRRREMTLGEFIRTKRIQRKGRKTGLGIKQLINEFEHKVVRGAQVPGSVLATPSAPSCLDDSDCDSWGSDFDDDETSENSTWEPQEEVENDINSMLEAAMERTSNLENSGLASNEMAQQLPERSDPMTSPDRHILSTEPNAPPLPQRNPGMASNISSENRIQRSRTSATNFTPNRNVCSTNQNLPLGSTKEKPVNPQWKNPATPPSSGTVAPPLSSSTAPFNRTPAGTTSTEAPVPGTSSHTKRVFPPDVIATACSSTPLPLWPSVVIKVANATSSFPKDVNLDLPRPHITSADLVQPHGSVKTAAVPPPLPSRPPPVTRFPVNNPGFNKNLIRKTRAASVPELEDDRKFINISLQSSVGVSFTQTQFEKNCLQKSSAPESAKPISNASSPVPTRPDSPELQQKPYPKSKPSMFNVPKILRELDAAVLKQVTPKTPSKSGGIGEMQQSLAEGRSCCEDGEKAEAAADNTTDEYLNPKEAPTAGATTHFTPDRPTLPRRLKHSRSLPLINLVDSLKRDPSKNKVVTDEKGRQKFHVQSSQATSETPVEATEFPAANDEVFRQPWYHPVTWPQAQFKLTAMGQDGAFLVRPSSRVSQGVPYTVSVFFNGRIINCHISCTPEKKYVLGKLKPNQKTFCTITEMIRYYQSTPAELKISEAEPVTKVCLLITPPKDGDKIYADL